MRRVVIAQEYVPHYRAPLFERLIAWGKDSDIEIVVAAGQPLGRQAARSDEVTIAGQRLVTQREIRVLGKRITVRRLSSVIEDADFLVIEQARRNLDAYPLLWDRRRVLPVALWGHGRDYTQHVGGVSESAQRWLTRRSDWFFAYTEGGRDAVVAQGYAPERVTVLNNAIDTSDLAAGIFALTEHAVADFKKRHGLFQNTALYMGGLDSSKRIQFLLESARLVHDRIPSFRLLIAGAGIEHGNVASFAEANPWCVMLGQVRGNEKWMALAAAQVLANPGRVGLIAVDSFASGVPIVTTSWPWHAPEFEYLSPGHNAVVSEDSVAGFAESMIGTLTNEPVLNRLSDNAAGAADAYSIDKMARRYLDGIHEWITSPHPGDRTERARNRFL